MKIPLFLINSIVFAGLVFNIFTKPSVAKAVVHPHVVYNPLEIDDLKSRISSKEEPLLSHYNYLKSSASQSLSGNNVYTGNDPKSLREGLDIDGPLMFSNAITYALDGQEANAKRARDLLIYWSTNSLKQINSYDDFSDTSNTKEAAAMFLGRAMFQVIPTYDLIYNSPSLTDQDKVIINTWLGKNASLIAQGMDSWFNSGSPMPCHQYSNHVSAQLTGLIMIGYMLEDEGLVTNAISGNALPTNWQKFLQQTIYMQGDPVIGCDSAQNYPTYTGEVVDRYRQLDHPGTDPNLKLNRGLGYSLLSTYNLALGAEAAYHHGQDLFNYFAPSGENLSLPGIYYAHYLKTFGPNDTLITSTNYPGEVMYLNQIMQKDFIKPYELLAYRFHNNINIANAFSKYFLPSRQGYNSDYLFGKLYRYDKLYWDFNLNNIAEGWTTPTNIISDGKLQITTRNTTTTLSSPKLFIRAADYPIFTARIKSNGGGTHLGTLKWGEGKSINFDVIADGVFRDYTIDLSKHTSWAGIISEIDLMPIDITNSTVVIDWIRLQKNIEDIPKPGDLNNDQVVNIFDFNILVAKFGNPYTIFDFNAIIKNFGN